MDYNVRHKKSLGESIAYSLLSTLLIISLLEVPRGLKVHCSDQTSDNEKVTRAIRNLFSANNTIRLNGRAEVLSLGRIAVVPLVNLLWDLIKHPHPRFISEREEEGKKALKHYIDLVRSGKQVPDNADEHQTILQLAINSRLMSDVISLLGELRSPEGVPVLIYIMENQSTGSSEPAGIELDALAKIGSPAIKNLIRSTENAQDTARIAFFRRPVTFGFVISFDPDDEVDDEETANQVRELELDSEEKAEIERMALKTKQKSVKALGQIGNQQALPFLENLIKTEHDVLLAPYVSAAIRQIKHEPHPGIGPVPKQ